MDDARLSVRWTVNLLTRARPFLARQFGYGYCSFKSRRFVNCFYDADVGQALQSIRFGLFVSANTFREIYQLRGELISLRKGAGLSFFACRKLMLDCHCILVRGINTKHAFGSNEFVAADVGGPKAARKAAQPLLRKAHHHRCHFFNALESFLPAAGCYRQYLRRLLAKKISRRINAIDSHVVNWPSATLNRFSYANIAV